MSKNEKNYRNPASKDSTFDISGCIVNFVSLENNKKEIRHEEYGMKSSPLSTELNLGVTFQAFDDKEVEKD